MELSSYYHKKLSHIPIEEVYVRIKEIGDALKGIKDLDIQIGNIRILLYVFGIKDSKLKTLSKLKNDAKYGFVSEFITKSARNIGIPNMVIQRYVNIRHSYRDSKVNKWVSDERKIEIKRKLREETFFLINLCLDEYSTQKMRERKIESLLKV